MAHSDEPKFEHDEPIEVSYVELLALVQPLLRRFERTEGVQGALKRLKSLMEDSSESWSATNEAKIRLAALPLLEEYVSQRMGRSGAVPAEEFQKCTSVQVALGILWGWLNEDLAAAEGLEADLEKSGVQLDPDAQGGGRRRTGGRGAPPSLLSEYVKHLLQERHPDWDDSFPFPGQNSKELREWLNMKLRQPPPEPFVWTSDASWADALDAYPFSPRDINPTSRGPLWRIISNLQRLQ